MREEEQIKKDKAILLLPVESVKGDTGGEGWVTGATNQKTKRAGKRFHSSGKDGERMAEMESNVRPQSSWVQELLYSQTKSRFEKKALWDYGNSRLLLFWIFNPAAGVMGTSDVGESRITPEAR